MNVRSHCWVVKFQKKPMQQPFNKLQTKKEDMASFIIENIKIKSITKYIFIEFLQWQLFIDFKTCMHHTWIKSKIKLFFCVYFVESNFNAYPSHPAPSHIEHIENTDINIASFSKEFLFGWVIFATILIENWKHTDGGNHNYSF